MNKKIILAIVVLGLLCTSLVAAGFLDSITGLFSLGTFRAPAKPAKPVGAVATQQATPATPSCVFIEATNGDTGKSMSDACKEIGKQCTLVRTSNQKAYYDSVDGTCSGKMQVDHQEERISGSNVCGRNLGLVAFGRCETEENNPAQILQFIEPEIGDQYVYGGFTGVLCCK